MRVLYIGGTGRISYACVRHSVEIGQEVTVFNRGRSSEPLPPTVRQITGDLNDPAAYRRLGHEPWDVVCQFKAYDLPRAELDREVFGGRCGQYVFISSASAYRKPPTTWRITEDVPVANPYWPYSQAKADIEHRLLQWHANGELPVTIVRPSHTNRDNFPGTFLGADDLAWRMLNARPTIVHGDGTALWVITHADDFARPFCNLLGNPAALGEAFHITSDEANTWNDILAAMADSLRGTLDPVHVPSETIVKYNPAWTGPLLGDKAWSVWFDNAKVQRVAGDFPPRVSMREGMARAAARHRDRLTHLNPDPALHALLDRMAEDQRRLTL